LPTPSPEHVERFDPRQLTVRRSEGHYELWAGKVFLKDFGTAQHDANAAAKLLRRLQANQHGTVGNPPVLDYWLVDGRPPDLTTAGPGEVPLDQTSLGVDFAAGTWQVRDGGTVFLDFGADGPDATLALAVCKHYGFNRLGRIGTDRPLMTYLLADPRLAPGFAPEQIGKRDRLAVMPQLLARKPLVLPGSGIVGDLVGIDSRRLEVRKGPDGAWMLESDGYVLERFGASEAAARSAARLLAAYGVTEQCRLGSGPTEFRFYLSAGRAPRGVRSGMTARPIPADRLALAEEGGLAELRCGVATLFAFGEDRETAGRVLEALRHFGFDAVAEDRSSAGGLRLLVRGRGE
jgi:hypothetical protein